MICCRIDYYELLIFVAFLIPIIYFDIKDKRIPDLCTLGGIAALLLYRILNRDFSFWLLFNISLGFAVIWLFWLASKQKIGLGDAKLSAFIALFLGLWGWAIALFAASFIGLAFFIVLIKQQKLTKRESIPFAPFFSLGAIVSFFLGNILLEMLNTRFDI